MEVKPSHKTLLLSARRIYLLSRYSCQHSLFSYVKIRKPYSSTISWVFHYSNKYIN